MTSSTRLLLDSRWSNWSIAWMQRGEKSLWACGKCINPRTQDWDIGYSDVCTRDFRNRSRSDGKNLGQQNVTTLGAGPGGVGVHKPAKPIDCYLTDCDGIWMVLLTQAIRNDQSSQSSSVEEVVSVMQFVIDDGEPDLTDWLTYVYAMTNYVFCAYIFPRSVRLFFAELSDMIGIYICESNWIYIKLYRFDRQGGNSANSFWTQIEVINYDTIWKWSHDEIDSVVAEGYRFV